MMYPMIVKPKAQVQRSQYTGRRVNIPSWLQDPDIPGPCLCGQPLMPNQPHIMGVGELGMKRWFHVQCWNMFVDDISEDDWDDED